MDLNTPVTEFRGLTEEQINRLTPKARQLTYADLVKLDRDQSDDRINHLTVKDIQSISAAFADYDPIVVQNSFTAEAACCCTCSPCCSCTAATVIQPMQ